MIEAKTEGLDELREYLRQIPPGNFDAAKAAVRTSVFNVQRDVTDRIRHGPLHSRTGQLARSMRTEVKGTNMRTLSGRVYTDIKYAPIHEFGGIISAKRAYSRVPGGPYLNIPSDANKTAAGVQRSTPGGVFNAGGYLVKLKASKSAKYAVMLNGVPMFWLVKQVEIPPRLGMRQTTDEEIPTLLSNLDDLLQEELE